MLRRWMWMMLVGAVILVAALYYAGTAMATPPEGFTGTTLALGRFCDIDVLNYFIPQNLEHEGHIWLSLQKTRESSDLYVRSNVWQPGGSTGWHSHPGP